MSTSTSQPPPPMASSSVPNPVPTLDIDLPENKKNEMNGVVTNDDNDDNTDKLLNMIVNHLKLKGLNKSVETLKNEIKNNNNNNRKRNFTQMSQSSDNNNNNNNDNDELFQMYSMYKSNNNSNPNSPSRSRNYYSNSFSLSSFGSYSQLFNSSNKSSISSIAYSRNGLYVSIGCCDGTLKIFNVNKLHECSFNLFIKKYDINSYSSDIHKPLLFNVINAAGSGSGSRINEIDFNPNINHSIITCCNTNGVINFYQYNKNKKIPIISIYECFNVSTIQYHPSGNYVIIGGDTNYIRLYDIKKEQGYIAKETGTSISNINQIRYSLTGNFYISATQSGNIKVYDGRNMNCVNIINGLHDKQSIHSIRFSKDYKYIVSFGDDDIIRLTDLRMFGKECCNYTGCKQNSIKSQVNFTYNDRHIISYSDVLNRILIYDTNTGNKINKIKDYVNSNTNSKNNNYVTYLATSPTESSFMCATKYDNKNRFYATIKQVQTNNDNNNDDIMNNNNNNLLNSNGHALP